MRTLLRHPLLHFVVLGALLYVAQPFAARDDDAFRIAIAADRLVELERGFAEQTGRRPGPVEVERMIAAEVDEEILFREALARGLLERDGGVQTRLLQKMLFLEGEADIEDAPSLLARAVELGLHHEDIVVRRILVQKMRLLGSALEAEQRVSDADVAAAYEAERESLRAPDRLSLTHVFLSRDRRGPETAADAEAVKAALAAASTPVERTPAQGDPFPLGHRLERRSRHDLQRTFGARFGEAVFAAEPGRWSGPFASAYGLHVVHVEAREPGRVPPLATVANRLRLQIEEERREANLAALLDTLRARYVVVRPNAASPDTASQEPG